MPEKQIKSIIISKEGGSENVAKIVLRNKWSAP